MSINIDNILSGLEAKISSMDSNTPLDDMILNIKSYQEAGGKLLTRYDSAGLLPDADSDYLGMLAFAGDEYYLLNDSSVWQSIGIEERTRAGEYVGGATAEIPWVFQGSVSGYVTGGQYPSANANLIRKFSFASDGNSTAGANLSRGSSSHAGHSSASHGYTSDSLAIDKFSFAADENGTDVGDLSVERYKVAGISSSDNGYSSGGRLNPPNAPSNVVDKFPFSSDASATDVGDLTLARGHNSGQSSADYGYTSGGQTPGGGGVDRIDKFPFSVDANATDVGNLVVAVDDAAGQSSDVSGYNSGGHPFGGNTSTNTISKFPFAADGNATDIGNLTLARGSVSGQSSTTSGYSAGGSGMGTPIAFSNVIDKFSFTSDGNATDVGDLAQGADNGITSETAGHQV